MLRVKDLVQVRQRFGARVRELRKAQGHSQESFAEACGLHRNYVGDIERAERNVSIDNIAKIAAGLKIGIRDLFPG